MKKIKPYLITFYESYELTTIAVFLIHIILGNYMIGFTTLAILLILPLILKARHSLIYYFFNKKKYKVINNNLYYVGDNVINPNFYYRFGTIQPLIKRENSEDIKYYFIENKFLLKSKITSYKFIYRTLDIYVLFIIITTLVFLPFFISKILILLCILFYILLTKSKMTLLYALYKAYSFNSCVYYKDGNLYSYTKINHIDFATPEQLDEEQKIIYNDIIERCFETTKIGF